MPITHAFDDTRPDDGTASLGPDAWNAAHVVEGAYTGTITIGSRTFTITDGQFVSVAAVAGFPRLALYMPPTTHSAALKARYDTVIFMLTETDATEIATMRSANPDITILVYNVANAVNILPTAGASHYLNVELRSVSADWFVTRVGSTLASSLDATSTSITVADGTKFTTGDVVVIGGTPASPFCADSPTNRTAEVAVVTNVSGNTLTVRTRAATGYEVWPSKAHDSGTYIAPIASRWVNTVQMNQVDSGTFACPSVDVGSGSETFNSWNARRSKTYLDSLDFDGVFLDTFDWQTAKIAGVDVNRDGTTDYNSSTLITALNAGLTAQASATRTQLGAEAVIVSNGSYYASSLNGQMFEGWPGVAWDLATWNAYYGGLGSPPQYGSYINSAMNATSPQHPIVVGHGGVAYSGTNGTAGFDADDYRYVRYSLCSALLADGYYCYDDDASSYATYLWWFDEYDNAGVGQGYLGQPTGDAVKLSTSLTGGVDNVWRRDYENGIVIVNPNVSGTVTVTLGATFTKIDGRTGYSDTTVNDGSSVTSVTLSARDGIVLLNGA